MEPKQILISSTLFSLVITSIALAQPHAPDALAGVAVVAVLQLRVTFGGRADVDRRQVDVVAKGNYATADSAKAFAKLLTADLRAVGNDKHLAVMFDPHLGLGAVPHAASGAKELANMREEMVRDGFGIARVERLPGNVGYLDVRGFGPTEFVGDAYSAALTLLAGTDALILDLRRNGGGEPASVAYLLSHFFAEGDERHLNDLYYRAKDETRQYWTNAAVKVRYTKPVYVLTSSYTFSGGEECAYDFQTQKRANGMVAFIPDGRAINPVTHTNWEHVGVKPDVAVAADKAQQTAYADILRTLVSDASDPKARQDLSAILARVEKGEGEKVNYAPPN